ncbi:cactin-like [Actinia tenebrosa]|uniref:Splicing factor Cactin n=1 Tax=Actinia tenebrosa TaxID=6105 RepID=A0A6P8I9S2_ACTTE|nr:cactin-like [Actinia tenebrosa]
MELEQGKNTEYWQDITMICKDELQKLRKQLHSEQLDRREGIHTAVHSDVASIFKGKTYTQLIALEKQIYSKISSGDAVDIGYWESLLQQLKIHMAKARLRERHQRMLREKLMQLRQEKSTMGNSSATASSESESESEKEEPPKEDQRKQDEPSTSTSWRDEPEEQETAVEDEAEDEAGEEASGSLFTEEELLEESYAAFEAGNYSPKLIKITDVDENLVIDPEEDWEKLLMLRQEVMSDGSSLLTKTLGLPTAMEQEEERKGMGPDEETFNIPVPLSQKKYIWEDKYRPRKPRFFNRVHTGYEWNKYNQTHYDSDNPPPKIVQGYKFNIFYPDLIEKTVAPEYYLDPCSDSKDFAILRFHAGPPYEDIAFKIVNREWEYSHRKGFRCQFHNNVFQLWFHFKRYRYRR